VLAVMVPAATLRPRELSHLTIEGTEGAIRDMHAPAHPAKFASERWTAKGEPRAVVALRTFETLWFNTGTLCNIACANCYIESSPRNDRLAYLSAADVRCYLEEIERERLPVRLIGFTGGEPFMNAAFPSILKDTLARGFETLTLTNAVQS
jgi:sulfatase maturation enzyme AslB (radical SAM superfamily)